TQAPTVTVVGANPLTVEWQTTVTDRAGAASDGCSASVSSATASGSVNTNVPGSYTVTYSATDASGNTGTATRTVNVVDTQAPTVTVTGANPMTVECHTTFTDPGATASDACDASVSSATASGSVNTNVPGSYTVTYSATDASGNTGTATRTVNVVDTQAPTVTVTGANPMTVECHTTFTDPGATASDACDASVTSATASGSVNTNVQGSYTVTYSATDASGNSGAATRTVNVVDTQAPTVTVTGANPMTVECHTAFSDPGAT